MYWIVMHIWVLSRQASFLGGNQLMRIGPKTKRKANHSMATLLRVKELMNAAQALRKLGSLEMLRREIKTPGNLSIYLSDRAYEEFLLIVEIAEQFLPSAKILEYEDIYSSCQTALGELYTQEGPSHEIDSFLERVEELCRTKISLHVFYTSLGGLTLEEMDEIEFGEIKISKADFQILKECTADIAIKDKIWESNKHRVWISQEILGSYRHAERRFFENANLACGMLAALFSSVLKGGGLSVRLIPTSNRYTPITSSTWFSIRKESKDLYESWTSGGLPLPMPKNAWEDLIETGYFRELTRITQRGPESDIEEAILRAIHWFFDAQADSILEMKMLKFWSCIECFFSFENSGKTTYKLSRGLTALLAHGGYRFYNPSEIKFLEREFERLYDLRSRAVHDARHGHVKAVDVTTLSKWASWVIIEVTSMASRGLKLRSDLKNDIDAIWAYIADRSPVE